MRARPSTPGFGPLRAAFSSARLLVAFFVLSLPLGVATAQAAGIADKYPAAVKFFPSATRFGSVEGNPPAASVYKDGRIIGYVFETKLVAPVPAYSGQPVNILVGVDPDGRIVGTKVLEQHEPILLVGIPVQKLYDFVHRYVGHKVTDDIVVGGGGEPGSVSIDAISSATVTSMAVNQTIMDAALKVAVSRRLVAEAPGAIAGPAKVRMDAYEPQTWQDLMANGSIGHLHITRRQVARAFKGQPAPLGDDVTATPPKGKGRAIFIDLYYTFLDPPSIGRNMLGKSAYADLMKRLKPGDHAIAVMANGRYSFKGIGYVRGGIFDRVHVVQGNKLVLFHDSDYGELADPHLSGMPRFKEKSVFIVRHGYGFDPGRSWTLQLLVRRQIGPLKSIYSTFESDFKLPGKYVEAAPTPKTVALGSSAGYAARAPLWLEIWRGRRFEIAVLGLGLWVLSLILIFQDWLVRRPRLLESLRVGFLIYTAVFIGWYGLAQLSVVNVLTFVNAVFHDFRWSTFLVDPLIFILWVFVAVSLLLIGRGVYCGWLCPYGALQALINKAARHFKVPQLEFPDFVHERLWAVKYVILLFLFGLSLQSVNLAERYAEVEPFKTAINLHFARSWAFVAYAAGLLVLSAVNSKFYCKYICPLGAALAIGGRYRLFEWLRRRKECGHPCQTCAAECEIRAINPIGQINFNECHYCLDCQMTYFNDHKCPPLVERRKRRERRERRSAPPPSSAERSGPVEIPLVRDDPHRRKAP